MHDIYFSFAEKIVLGLGIIACLASFIYEVSRRLLIVFKGLGTLPFDRFGARFWRMFREVFLHEKVVKGRFWPGLMHAFVFWGFVIFGLVTIDHFAKGFGFSLLSPNAHRVYTMIVTPFSILVIVGILSLAYRRFITKPKALGKLSPTSGLVAFFIVVLMVTYLIGEREISTFFWKINWWIHSAIILAFLFLIPRSKHLHLVLAPINIFFRPFDQPDHTLSLIHISEPTRPY